jgi:hypothetical protein
MFFIEPIEVTNVFTSEPINGMYYVAQRSNKVGRAGSVWWKMPVSPTAGPERISVAEVPKKIKRQAQRYFNNQKGSLQRYLQGNVKWTTEGWDKVA